MVEENFNMQQNESAEQESDASASDIDLQELAQQIFDKFRRELEIENERMGLS